MALIDFGTNPNTSTGDTLYAAFVKINNIIGNGKGNFSSNTATGTTALNANTTGVDGTANGNFALANNTTGIKNTAVGSVAMLGNTTGSGNTGVGMGALYNAVSLNSNTAVGVDALASNTLYSNCSGLGRLSSVTGNNQVQLGDGDTTTYVFGTVQNRSDLRDKAEVRDTVLGLDFINELRPVDYKWDMREDYRTETNSELSELIHDGTHTRSRFHHGLIAQEVQDVIEASGVDFGGFQDHKVGGGDDVLSIGYDELIAPMIKAIQELTARINALEGN
jgi:hypothetical protein